MAYSDTQGTHSSTRQAHATGYQGDPYLPKQETIVTVSNNEMRVQFSDPQKHTPTTPTAYIGLSVKATTRVPGTLPPGYVPKTVGTHDLTVLDETFRGEYRAATPWHDDAHITPAPVHLQMDWNPRTPTGLLIDWTVRGYNRDGSMSGQPPYMSGQPLYMSGQPLFLIRIFVGSVNILNPTNNPSKPSYFEAGLGAHYTTPYCDTWGNGSQLAPTINPEETVAGVIQADTGRDTGAGDTICIEVIPVFLGLMIHAPISSFPLEAQEAVRRIYEKKDAADRAAKAAAEQQRRAEAEAYQLWVQEERRRRDEHEAEQKRLKEQHEAAQKRALQPSLCARAIACIARVFSCRGKKPDRPLQTPTPATYGATTRHTPPLYAPIVGWYQEDGGIPQPQLATEARRTYSLGINPSSHQDPTPQPQLGTKTQFTSKPFIKQTYIPQPPPKLLRHLVQNQ